MSDVRVVMDMTDGDSGVARYLYSQFCAPIGSVLPLCFVLRARQGGGWGKARCRVTQLAGMTNLET